MNDHINKLFFLASLIIHIILLVLFFFLNTSNKIHNKFLVLGRYSKKPTHAYFKQSKPANKSDWLGMRKQEMQRNIQARKEAQLKREAITRAKAKAETQKKKTQTKATQKAPAKKTISKPSPPKASIKKTAKQPQIKEPPTPKAPPKKKEQKKTTPLKKSKEKETFEKHNKEEELQKEETLHFNLMGDSDPSLANYQNHIQREVERLWHPPIGIPKGTECSLNFVVNSKGDIETFEFVEKSNVLIYDLSVSRIAKKFKFNKCLWNKKFTINFRQ